VQSLADFLRDKGRIRPYLLPHYLRWIELYRKHAAALEATSGPAGSSSGAAFSSYLTQLARDREHWQVSQARHAVRLYLYYRQLQGGGASDGVSPVFRQGVFPKKIVPNSPSARGDS
jgi:hypothetical protein